MLRFGTDGVRGRAYDELHPDDVVRLAQAAAEVMAPTGPVVIGRDTRASSPDFADSLITGFSAVGVPTLDMGVAPTPAVAWTAARDHTPGAMVSASHNPWPDNGVKLFGPGGRKLGDEVQAALESVLADPNRNWAPDPAGSKLTADASELLHDYQTAVAATADFDGHGLRVVVDAAHGSATAALPSPLQAHGVAVTVINAEPDGRNINHRCGSTFPEAVAEEVVRQGADLGLTFDGDADRVLAVDHTGELVDGDQIIAICAVDRRQRGRLPGNTVVVTVMTNLGFHRAMSQRGINVVTTPVGDRHVWSALQDGDWALGGEQSGHVIFPTLANTGDGLVTALQLLQVVAHRGIPLNDLAAEAMTKMPQVLHNVATGPNSIDENRLNAAVAAAEQTLGTHGRILVRPSGTEPVIRIMVEAETSEIAESVATEVAKAIGI
ncbi:MAG: phosphoglucosamine mutase [Acidimicrobiia bacterium]|nr:phosphoglucosamine mutase [Acidimicrobiia bacterium]MCY4434259.1 phosphoglucosamine mutase [bacterium]